MRKTPRVLNNLQRFAVEVVGGRQLPREETPYLLRKVKLSVRPKPLHGKAVESTAAVRWEDTAVPVILLSKG